MLNILLKILRLEYKTEELDRKVDGVDRATKSVVVELKAYLDKLLKDAELSDTDSDVDSALDSSRDYVLLPGEEGNSERLCRTDKKSLILE